MRATYRIQLGGDVDFAFVAGLVPYLQQLGVSHLYLSPAMQARSGSAHGYDVVDPTRVSDALGGERGLRALRAAGLPIVLDVVPNHLGAGEENRWWADRAQRERVFDVRPGSEFVRRFFDIDDLCAVRVEREEVFDLIHRKPLELLRDGVLDGLRVDHPDGLADPAGYLRRLRDAGAQRVWVEKILHPGEPLRDWPVSGTVGYEFLNDVCALFVEQAGAQALAAFEPRPFADVALAAQREQAAGTFRRELDWLLSLAPSWLDTGTLVDALAALPVYRTYVEPWSGLVDEQDRRAIEPFLDARLAGVLELRERGYDEFVTRFQQTSPPVCAKGVEDTAFYRHLRLLALNEVGGDPGRFGVAVADFHAANLRRAQRFPLGLLSTMTHDAKRSHDVRARIAALSALASEWVAAVNEWFALTDALLSGGAPDREERYLIFQTLVGAWPIDAERLAAYVLKALREAKRNTSWVDADERWEAAALRYARALVSHRPFLQAFEPFQRRVAERGRADALAQVLLKLCSPGVPDIYQGDELEYLALVDPDNRRPVDWDARRAALAASAPDPKLDAIRRTLALRARRPELFAGGYAPLSAQDAVCAFSRGGGGLLCAVPVRPGGGAVRVDDALAGRWHDALRGETVTLATGGLTVERPMLLWR